MNTKSIPPVLALVAGLVTCIMSFIQHVDSVVFAKRFVIVCIIFFVIGSVASIVININFKDMAEEQKEPSEEGEEAAIQAEDLDEAEGVEKVEIDEEP